MGRDEIRRQVSNRAVRSVQVNGGSAIRDRRFLNGWNVTFGRDTRYYTRPEDVADALAAGRHLSWRGED